LCDLHYGRAAQDSPVHGEGEEESGAISPRSRSRGLDGHGDPQPNLCHAFNFSSVKLQNLLIKFQSGNPELWIEAGEQVRAWVNDERSIDFFEEAGSSLHEEGEEEEDQMMMMNPNLVRQRRDGRSYDYEDDGDAGDPGGPARGVASSSAALLADLGRFCCFWVCFCLVCVWFSGRVLSVSVCIVTAIDCELVLFSVCGQSIQQDLYQFLFSLAADFAPRLGSDSERSGEIAKCVRNAYRPRKNKQHETPKASEKNWPAQPTHHHRQ